VVAPVHARRRAGGAYVARLDERQREELKARCAARLPDGAFEVEAAAWAATGTA